MIKRVTFITTGQPTTNPRLVKEAETLSDQGYEVKVICCFYQPWARKFDVEINSKNPGMYIYCGGDPLTSKFSYLKTRLRQKICTRLFKITKGFDIPENAVSRTHAEALSLAKKINTDLYIAHNLGALPAAVSAAKYNNAKIGYDAEDMHSGQFNSDKHPMYLLNKYIEEKYFGQVDYFTTASPLIAENYSRMYPCLKPVVINNVFPKTNLYLKQNYKVEQPLKLLWFSQTVGPDRGIEQVITALGSIDKNIELHLLGNCTSTYKTEIANLATKCGYNQSRVHFHSPVSPNELLKFAALFDIGMATETASNLNRDICLTNKIFTYIQCGLAIIASDTQAQSLFLNEFPNTCKLYKKNDLSSLTAQISYYAKHPEELYKTRMYNYQLGQTGLNWENESKIFLNVVKNTLA